MSEQDDQVDALEPAAIETPEPAATPGVKDPTGLRDTIKKAVADSKLKAEVAAKGKPDGRSSDGKFLPKDQQAAPDKAAPQTKDATQKPLEGAQTDAAGKPKADAAPGTWKPEARAKWGTVDPVVKAEVLRTQADATREIAKHQNELKQVKTEFDEIDAVLANRKGFLKANYGSIGKALNELFRLSDWAGSKPGEFAQWLFQQTGHNPQAPGNGQPADQALAPILQKVTGLEGQLQSVLADQQQRQNTSVGAEIQTWKDAKDQAGNPLHPHYDALTHQIFGLMPSIRQNYPNESPTQHMERGYQAAVAMSPEISALVREEIETKARDKFEADARMKKAVGANKSVTGTAPINGALGPKDPKDLRATIRAALRAQQEGTEARI